jgi:hypothetical protein
MTSLEERVAFMSIRTSSAHGALAALCAAVLLSLAPGAAGAKTVTAELRVLTPTRVLDPGTTYVVGAEKVRTDPAADCNFGGAGGSGASFDFPEPNALGLLAAGADANRRLRPLSITDEFGFGLAICGIGKVDDRPGTFWYLKRDHRELTVGADQEPIHDGDEFLVYLAPDMFPAPNPAELELRGPARARPGAQFTVRAVEHACVTDQTTFEVSCESTAVEGVEIRGGSGTATTGSDGSARVTARGEGRLRLVGRRGTDIPSNRLEVCVDVDRDGCPAKRGDRIVGRSTGDRIVGTAGADAIRARGGGDRIDIRGGGPDGVSCGPGKDAVLVKRSDRNDRLSRDCERIRRR